MPTPLILRKGTTLLEVLVALGIVVILMYAVYGLVGSTKKFDKETKAILEATAIAQGGMEGVRNIRDSNLQKPSHPAFDNNIIYDQNCGLNLTGSNISLNCPASDTFGNYQRTINVHQIDPDTFKVTSTVSGVNLSHDIVMTEELTNWRKP